jgi:DNA (cytosine-5)-methyltransferase 1
LRGEIIRIADLFSGCGAMTLGLLEACRAVGLRGQPILAVDSDQDCVATFALNFPGAKALCSTVEALLDKPLGSAPSFGEKALVNAIGQVDFLLAGPPCQGSSDLNNRTRRDDSRNALMGRLARFAELFRPAHVIIENVQGVLHDRGRIVDHTVSGLSRLGYSVSTGLVESSWLGVAQKRRRFIMLASLGGIPSVQSAVEAVRREERDVAWAIADLSGKEGTAPLDTPSLPSSTNRARLEHLFANGLYELPDEYRPTCHRNGHHTYKSVYGRLRWDAPAATITTGFTSMGQGRFVHPAMRRTLTPHEAARLQFLPDFFAFPNLGRTKLAMLIGNAVPPKLAYTLGLSVLGEPL